MGTPGHVVILIHGIRTYGHWQVTAKRILEGPSADQTRCEILRYGYFDLLRFLLPLKYFRRQKVRELVNFFHEVRERFPGADISAIAHSFGTYLVTEALLIEPDFRLRYLILCGSIVPADYRWHLVVGTRVAKVRNDYSHFDLWPVLAKLVTLGYGWTGTYGVFRPGVDDRYQAVGHSGYFSHEHIEACWQPFIERGVLESPTEETPQRALASWWATLILAAARLAQWCVVLLFPLMALVALFETAPIPVDEAKWFPSESINARIEREIGEGTAVPILDGYFPLDNRRTPYRIEEVQLFYDTQKLSLEQLNMMLSYRVVLRTEDSHDPHGHWWVSRVTGGKDLHSAWRREQETTDPDLVDTRGDDAWNILIRLSKLDDIPNRIHEFLTDVHLRFDDLQPTLVIGVVRRRYYFESTDPRKPRVLLDLSRVTSSTLAAGRSLRLPPIEQIPRTTLSSTWEELEVEEPRPSDLLEKIGPLRFFWDAPAPLVDRLRDFRRAYELDAHEEDVLPKYQRAVDMARRPGNAL